MLATYNILITIYVFFYRFIRLIFPPQDEINVLKHNSLLGKNLSSKKKILVKFKNAFWFHAVSAGEVILVNKIIQKYFSSQKIVISYMSNSAHLSAKKLFKNKKNITHFFLTFDLFSNMKKLVEIISPQKFFVIEHDTWANLLSILEKKNIPRVMLNYHLKPRDFFFYKLFPSAFRLTHNFSTFLVQDNSVLKKVEKLKPKFKLANLGNLKYDFSTSSKSFKFKSNKKIITLASSHIGEEKIITSSLLPLLKKKKIILIIIPRHIARSLKIKDELKKNHPHLLIAKIDNYLQLNDNHDIIVLNQFSVVRKIYAISNINLIGDSFKKSAGGHNLIESVVLNKPTFYGKYFINYQELTKELEKVYAHFRLSEKEIFPTISNLINDKKLQTTITKKAFAALQKFKYDEKKLKRIIFD